MRALSPSSPEYPARLRAVRSPPPLWILGTLPPGPAVVVVGTRRPTRQAERFTEGCARSLVEAGFSVWSGGALGVDWAAHEGALAAGGRTVVVAGSGLSVPYPHGAEDLWRRAAERGAVLSVVPPEAPPKPPTFFRRNGVLAALSDAVVLVECPLDSGARNTTAQARRLGRPVWVLTHSPWALGGPAAEVEARLGGRPFSSVAALLEGLGCAAPSRAPAAARVDPIERALEPGPAHVDELAAVSGLPVAELQARLVQLQLEGRVDTDGEGRWLVLA